MSQQIQLVSFKPDVGLAFLKRLGGVKQRIPLTKSKTGEIVKGRKSLEGSLFPVDLDNVNINKDTTSLLLNKKYKYCSKPDKKLDLICFLNVKNCIITKYLNFYILLVTKTHGCCSLQ